MSSGRVGTDHRITGSDQGSPVEAVAAANLHPSAAELEVVVDLDLVATMQPSLFGVTRCGYCDRFLVRIEDRYECARCAPILRTLGRFLPYEAFVVAFAAFQRAAWESRDHQDP